MELEFTKLGSYLHYTDIILVGIETGCERNPTTDDIVFEQVERYSILHTKPKAGMLVKQTEITEYEGHDIFTSLLQYYQLGKNTLMVVNNSAVFLGSSDLIALLDSEVYDIAKGDMYGEQIAERKEHKVSQQIFIANAPPTVVVLKSKYTKTTITIVDIANYGIKDIKQQFMQCDVSLVKDFPGYMARILDPDKSDVLCIALYLVMSKYYGIVHKHKLGGLAVTYSAQGMRAYRSNHYENEITKHRDEQAAYVEEKCYFGGRGEARYVGRYNSRVYLLDINSYYPSIALSKPFPCKLRGYVCNAKPERDRFDTMGKWYTAHCNISINEPFVPCRTDKGIMYPIGTFDTYLCGEEFSECLKRGAINKIYYLAEYGCGSILKGYAECMLGIRGWYKGSNDILGEQIVKWITNGLWGKFAEIGSRWIVDTSMRPPCLYGGFSALDPNSTHYNQYRVINGEVSRLCRVMWSNNTFLPVTCAMNSYCRMQLWRYMQFAGMGNVLYCGIDALIVTEDGYNNLKPFISDNKEAYGMFRVSETGESCYIAGVGRYRIGSKTAIAGVPNSDEMKYRGFWNYHDDRYILNQCKGQLRVQAMPRKKPTEVRRDFGTDVTVQGSWVEPASVIDLDETWIPEYKREYQSSFLLDDHLQ